MANAYSTPEKTAKYMEHLDKNHDRIMELRHTMNDSESSMEDCVLAFTELYDLLAGDEHAQRRLVVNLGFTAKRHQQAATSH